MEKEQFFQISKDNKIIVSCFELQDTINILNSLPYNELKKTMVHYKNLYNINGTCRAYEFIEYLF